MVKALAIYLYLLGLATMSQVRGQYGTCDYVQELKVGQTYTIYSPNYPNIYFENTYCRWKAIAPAGHSILLSCPTFQIPDVSKYQTKINYLLYNISITRAQTAEMIRF